jgi:hypothetical protein
LVDKYFFNYALHMNYDPVGLSYLCLHSLLTEKYEPVSLWKLR